MGTAAKRGASMIARGIVLWIIGAIVFDEGCPILAWVGVTLGFFGFLLTTVGIVIWVWQVVP
jgi:hypothetical protein